MNASVSLQQFEFPRHFKDIRCHDTVFPTIMRLQIVSWTAGSSDYPVLPTAAFSSRPYGSMTSSKHLLLCAMKVMTTKIHVNRMARQMDRNAGKYTGGGKMWTASIHRTSFCSFSTWVINILNSQDTYIYFILYVNIQETLKARKVPLEEAGTDLKQLLQ
jgi:hypothetical protein